MDQIYCSTDRPGDREGGGGGWYDPTGVAVPGAGSRPDHHGEAAGGGKVVLVVAAAAASRRECMTSRLSSRLQCAASP